MAFEFEFGAKKRQLEEDRNQRMREAVSIANDLMKEGFTPPEINAVTKRYIDQGQYQVPTMRTQALPPEPGVDVGQRSTQVPIQARSAVAATRSYNSKTPDAGVGDYIIADSEGNELKRIPRTKNDRLVTNREDPTIQLLQMLLGTSGATPGSPAPAPAAPSPAAPRQPVVKPPVKQSKKLTHEQASQFLAKAGGDKKKARELATQAGYEF